MEGFEEIKKGLGKQWDKLEATLNNSLAGLSPEQLEKVQPLQTEFNSELRKARKRINSLTKKHANINRKHSI